jgi:hypothetical protein
LFTDVEELWERQKKLERYIKYLQEKRVETLGTLEKRISEQDKKISEQNRQIEKLKERTELMAKDALRLKEQINKLTELVEYVANKQKRQERLEF